MLKKGSATAGERKAFCWLPAFRNLAKSAEAWTEAAIFAGERVLDLYFGPHQWQLNARGVINFDIKENGAGARAQKAARAKFRPRWFLILRARHRPIYFSPVIARAAWKMQSVAPVHAGCVITGETTKKNSPPRVKSLWQTPGEYCQSFSARRALFNNRGVWWCPSKNRMILFNKDVLALPQQPAPINFWAAALCCFDAH